MKLLGINNRSHFFTSNVIFKRNIWVFICATLFFEMSQAHPLCIKLFNGEKTFSKILTDFEKIDKVSIRDFTDAKEVRDPISGESFLLLRLMPHPFFQKHVLRDLILKMVYRKYKETKAYLDDHSFDSLRHTDQNIEGGEFVFLVKAKNLEETIKWDSGIWEQNILFVSQVSPQSRHFHSQLTTEPQAQIKSLLPTFYRFGDSELGHTVRTQLSNRTLIEITRFVKFENTLSKSAQNSLFLYILEYIQTFDSPIIIVSTDDATMRLFSYRYLFEHLLDYDSRTQEIFLSGITPHKEHILYLDTQSPNFEKLIKSLKEDQPP